jgi:SOS-response transcriptional repressor LexA
MILDAKGFFARVCEAMGTESAPEIARKLGISKNAVYFWANGNMPGLKGLKNVLKVAATTNTSLVWLLTGQRPRILDESLTAELNELVAALSVFAREENSSPAAVVREAVTEYLASRGAIADQEHKLNVILYRSGDMIPIQIVGEISEGGPIVKYETYVMERVAAEFKSIERIAHALRVTDDSFAPELFKGDLVVYSDLVEAANGSTVIAAIDGEHIKVGTFYRTRDGVIIRSGRPNEPDVKLSESRVKILGAVVGVQRPTSSAETLRKRPRT